jgi:hypothetical protein
MEDLEADLHTLQLKAPELQAKEMQVAVNRTALVVAAVKRSKDNLGLEAAAVVQAVLVENGLLEVERIMLVEEELVTILQELQIMAAAALVAVAVEAAEGLVLQYQPQ